MARECRSHNAPILVLPFRRPIIDENDNGFAGIDERSQEPAGSFPRTCLAEACRSDVLARSSIQYTEGNIWSAFIPAGERIVEEIGLCMVRKQYVLVPRLESTNTPF
jgi:hypothetical protein